MAIYTKDLLASQTAKGQSTVESSGKTWLYHDQKPNTVKY